MPQKVTYTIVLLYYVACEECVYVAVAALTVGNIKARCVHNCRGLHHALEQCHAEEHQGVPPCAPPCHKVTVNLDSFRGVCQTKHRSAEEDTLALM